MLHRRLRRLRRRCHVQFRLHEFIDGAQCFFRTNHQNPFHLRVHADIRGLASLVIAFFIAFGQIKGLERFHNFFRVGIRQADGLRLCVFQRNDAYHRAFAYRRFIFRAQFGVQQHQHAVHADFVRAFADETDGVGQRFRPFKLHMVRFRKHLKQQFRLHIAIKNTRGDFFRRFFRRRRRRRFGRLPVNAPNP